MRDSRRRLESATRVVSTTSAVPPQRRSSSLARSVWRRVLGRRRSGPSTQKAPATVWSPSTQAARSPPATVPKLEARTGEGRRDLGWPRRGGYAAKSIGTARFYGGG